MGEEDSSSSIVTRAGEEVELRCESVGGNPVPSLTWYIGQKEVRGDQIAGQAVSTLVVTLNKTDNGNVIRCEAMNEALETPLVAAATLDVQCKYIRVKMMSRLGSFTLFTQSSQLI